MFGEVCAPYGRLPTGKESGWRNDVTGVLSKVKSGLKKCCTQNIS